MMPPKETTQQKNPERSKESLLARWRRLLNAQQDVGYDYGDAPTKKGGIFRRLLNAQQDVGYDYESSADNNWTEKINQESREDTLHKVRK